MQVDIQRILKYSRLRGSDFIAGRNGASNLITGVTVMEISDLDEIGSSILSINPGDLVLTAFNDIKHDVFKQALLINRLKTCHAAGLILFYVGKVVKKIDPQIIELCDNLCFPLICPPSGANHPVNYSGVIRDVMSLLIEEQTSPQIGNTALVNTLIESAKCGEPLESAFEALQTKLPCSFGIFDSNQLPIAAYGPRSEGLLPDLQSLSTTLGFDKTLRIPGSNSYFKRVRCFQDAFWLGVAGADGMEDGVQAASAFHILELVMKLWSEDFSQNSERELIKAIVKHDLEKIDQLSRLQHVDLNQILAFFIISAKESQPAFSAFQQRLSSFYDAYGLHAVSASYQNCQIVLLFSSEDRPSPSGLPLSELTNHSPFQHPLLACPAADRDELLHLLPVSLHAFPDLLAVYSPRKILSKAEVLLLLQYQGTKSRRNHVFGAYCARMLQRLEEYDQKNHGEITETLVEFLLYDDMDCRAIARRRYTHYNTIKYRIRKAEELLHLSTKKPGDLSVLYTIAFNKVYKGLK